MKNSRNFAKVLMVALATQVCMDRAEAHAPVTFPITLHHNSPLFVPANGFKTLNKNVTNTIYSQTSGVSGATRTWLINVKSNIFEQFNIGKTLGQQLFTGGSVSSGVLSGTYYLNFSGNTYTRIGTVIDAIGSNPNNTGNFFNQFSGSSANVLNFTGGVGTLPQGPFKVSQILGVHLTGSQSAYFSQYTNAGRGGLNQGILKGPSLSGSIAGGEFTGLYYGRPFFSSTYFRGVNSLLAFGNDPLNTLNGPSTITLSSNPTSFFTYPSGVLKTVLAGQQNYTIYQSFFGSPFFSTGAFIKTIGTDPLNLSRPSSLMATFPGPTYYTLLGTKFHF
jgi:hypothetical protein